jgi:guanylate kinase
VLVLDIDIQGAQQIKQVPHVQANFLFVRPPSLHELAKRLEARHTETPESLSIRLRNAAMELEFLTTHPEFFRAVVSNDDLGECSRRLAEVLKQWYPWLLSKV